MDLKNQIAIAIFNAKLSKNNIAELGHNYESIWAESLEEAEACVKKPIRDTENIMDLFTPVQIKLIKLLIRENQTDGKK